MNLGPVPLLLWAAGPRTSFGFEGVPGGWGRWLEASRYRVVTVGTGGTGF